MLTEAEALAARPRDKDYKIADGHGLILHVGKGGGKSWRYRYRISGREQLLVFGSFPGLSLKEARAKRDSARALLQEGRDPGLEAKAEKLRRQEANALTFEKAALEWHANQLSRWTPVHADDVIRSLERDLFPSLGAHPICDIDKPMLLTLLRRVEQRGAIETAHRLRQRVESIYKYAAALGLVMHNPATDLSAAMKPVPASKRWPAFTKLDAIRAMLADIDAVRASPGVKTASRFLALTAQRPGMVRLATWSEIEGVDWDSDSSVSPLWRIPAARMKVELQLQDDEAYDQEVPLSHQAVEILRAMRSINGTRNSIFTSAWGNGAGLSENGIGKFYNDNGYRGRHVPHGWRSSFSTVMNGRVERAQPGADRLVIDRLIIDLMLAHRPSGMSESEFRYNRFAYMDRRRELAQEWADLILEGAVPANALVVGPRRAIAH